MASADSPSFPRLLRDPVAALLAQIEAARQPRTLVALAGVPGSGKSTVASHLARAVNAALGQPTAMLALGMDGFHLPKAALHAMPDPDLAFARRGAPWTFDPASLAARLTALRTEVGRVAVPWPDFRHEVGDPVEAAILVPADVRLVLVEGLYLLLETDGWAEVAASFDERWFLDVPLDLALHQLAGRHMAAWGYTRKQAEAQIAANDGLNAETVMTTRGHADWLLANDFQPSLSADAR